jgi:hypothetical protein
MSEQMSEPSTWYEVDWMRLQNHPDDILTFLVSFLRAMDIRFNEDRYYALPTQVRTYLKPSEDRS